MNVVYFVFITLLTLLARQVYLPTGKVSGFIFCGMIGVIALLIYILLANKLGLSERLFGRDIGK